MTTNNWLKINQQNDPETQHIKGCLEERKSTHDYFHQNGIPFRKLNPGQNPQLYRAFVPKGSRFGLLRMFHDDEQCHVGPDKIFCKSKSLFLVSWHNRIH
ncbi:hypothetical protein GWI33_014269 [Rhynchophorus ferrugineus]|uniref:Uncharacterized protein n=1 Tax=Rhynchophorus ferrugineus TaxID=354439 RepID=A0A834IFF6_RHYFE|nr:hypothetical protein GWI33_014269 [Rhynchophorus ferrugineus]